MRQAGLDRAISLGWLELHESGTLVRLTELTSSPKGIR
jgi:hypothetical protein